QGGQVPDVSELIEYMARQHQDRHVVEFEYIGNYAVAGSVVVTMNLARTAAATEAVAAIERGFPITESVAINAKTVSQAATQFEEGVAALYDAYPRAATRFYYNEGNVARYGIADRVVEIGDQAIAIEAKFIGDWSRSAYNPAGIVPQFIRDKVSAKAVQQASTYLANFDQMVIHTNSTAFATTYRSAFQNAGLDMSRIQFRITGVR
ncbi:MAG: hypothetical protein JNL74_12015, partial [Fibrobacteres bacterium]|nr:hypothetical protein [Fibrobacterota bacterium]